MTLSWAGLDYLMHLKYRGLDMTLFEFMLKSISLENFRNYQNLQLNFKTGAGLTYFIGDNGQGKTNILEAIYMLALGKSFRVSDQENLIKWEEDYGRVRGEINLDGQNSFGNKNDTGNSKFDRGGVSDLEIFLGKAPQPRRVYKVNQVKTGAEAFIGRMKAVFFHPEDLNVLYLGPELRRRYLDIMILQKEAGYMKALRRFQRLKEQRNALLMAIREGSGREADLEIWDEQLVVEGAFLWKKRARAIEYISARLSDKYSEISGQKSVLKISYVNSLEMRAEVMDVTSNLEDLMRNLIQINRRREMAAGRTLTGPHRDELIFELNGHPIMLHASRGEIRTILLALKMIEMEYLSEDGSKPVLLLDDVFSELDHQRQKYLLERVAGFQTFITTTKDSAVINQEKLLAGAFVEIESGIVRK